MADEPAYRAFRAAWLDAGDLQEQQRISAELQMHLWRDVLYIPMGEYWQATAYREDLLDVLPGAFAVFYGVQSSMGFAELRDNELPGNRF